MVSSYNTQQNTFRVTWNRKWSLRPIEVCGETIELSNEVKLLGIKLDSKLKLNTHIDNITKKCIEQYARVGIIIAVYIQWHTFGERPVALLHWKRVPMHFFGYVVDMSSQC